MSRWLILLSALLLSGCALLRPAPPPLLAPGTLQQQLQLNQTLVSEIEGHRHQMLIAAKITNDILQQELPRVLSQFPGVRSRLSGSSQASSNPERRVA